MPTSATTNGSDTDRVKKMSGKYFNVFLAFTVITVPMVLLPALLLWIVFTYGLAQHATLPDLQTTVDTEQRTTSAFYVDFNSTTLVLLASLMSIVSSSLVPSFMVLYSYPIMSRIARKSQNSENADLPTPFQLSLLIQLLKGGLGPAWAWVKYIFGWRGKRVKITKEVRWAGALLVATIGLSLLMSVANVWLHLTTKAVQFSQVIGNGEQRHAYGRGLSSKCTEWYITFPDSAACTAGGGHLLEEEEIFHTLYNTSTNNRVISHNHSGQVYALITDPKSRPDVDFTASTLAVATQCELITKDCNHTHPASVSMPFNCQNINFAGDLAGNQFIFNSFNGSDGKHNDTTWVSVNPYYWALASLAFNFNYALDDPDMIETYDGLATVMWCNTTVYDATYSQVNGSVTDLTVTQSNATIGGIFHQPLRIAPGKWQPELKNVLLGAALMSNTSQEFLSPVASAFSELAATFASGGMSPRDNIEDQTRNSLIVARVPKAPLYTIVILGFFHALLGVALTIIALWMSGDGVHDTVAKASIEGLVAERFEEARRGKSVEEVVELFEEWDGQGSGRVGVHKGESGGWEFTVVK